MPSDNPSGDCEAIAQYVYDQLEQYGLTPDYYKIDEEATAAVGMIRVANVVAEIPFGHSGPNIVLNAHGDVVPPRLGWTVDPYGGQIIEGKLYGRGAAVSKSDIAAYTFAALALRECHGRLLGKLVLAFTFDEVVELLQAIYRYRKRLERIYSNIEGITSPTLNVGLISGGINTNVVPDCCVIRLDRRIIPEEQAAEVEAELRSYVEAAARDIPGVQLEIRRTLLAESFGPVSEHTPIVQHLKENWSNIMEGTLPVNGVPLYADARHFYQAGIPTVMFGAGPRTLEEANGHRADEHVWIEDLLNATKIVALTLHDLLNNQAEPPLKQLQLLLRIISNLDPHQRKSGGIHLTRKINRGNTFR